MICVSRARVHINSQAAVSPASICTHPAPAVSALHPPARQLPSHNNQGPVDVACRRGGGLQSSDVMTLLMAKGAVSLPLSPAGIKNYRKRSERGCKVVTQTHKSSTNLRRKAGGRGGKQTAEQKGFSQKISKKHLHTHTHSHLSFERTRHLLSVLRLPFNVYFSSMASDELRLKVQFCPTIRNPSSNELSGLVEENVVEVADIKQQIKLKEASMKGRWNSR